MEPRPRLQRSFTVSSSNMGVERRSAVGRRMVARLAERAADKQAEVEEQEAEVRRLWEERTGRVEPEGPEGGEQLDGFDASQDHADAGNGEEEELDPCQPIVVIRDPEESFHGESVEQQYDSLMPPRDDRPGSRNTQMSDTDVFEYAQHLSRSQSTRTARNMPITPEKERGEVQEGVDPEETLIQSEAGAPVEPDMFEQTRPAESVHGAGLSSISFTVDDPTSGDERHVSNGVPMSVGDQSGDWGTPGKDARKSEPSSCHLVLKLILPSFPPSPSHGFRLCAHTVRSLAAFADLSPITAHPFATLATHTQRPRPDTPRRVHPYIGHVVGRGRTRQ